jgi:hypothetical protein
MVLTLALLLSLSPSKRDYLRDVNKGQGFT